MAFTFPDFGDDVESFENWWMQVPDLIEIAVEPIYE